MSMSVTAWNQHYEPLLPQVRSGCEPRLLLQSEEKVENAIVLVHGLTDSPYFMEAIGQRFYQMGFTVLMPLLPGHGLSDPRRMKGVRYEQWLAEVQFAVEQAHSLGQRVSLGGLSLGGALSVMQAIATPETVTGGLFLFAAALDLGTIGDVGERVLRINPLVKILARIEDATAEELIGESPYRYGRMDLDGASQLARLLGAIDTHYTDARYTTHHPKYSDITPPVFVAHAENDAAADIQELDQLVNNHPGGALKTSFFRIAARFQVSHASLVLADNLYSSRTGELLEAKNPFFDDMMDAAQTFLQKQGFLKAIA